MIEIKKERCDPDYQPNFLENLSRKQGYQKFRMAGMYLSQKFQPQDILCRDNEISRIRDFIKEFMISGYAKESLYISGVPGIGKTLSVNKAIQQHKNNDDHKKGKLVFVRLNAMKLAQQTDIYKALYNGLLQHTSKGKKNTKISSYSAMVKLDTIFRRDEIEDQIDQQIKEMRKVVFIDEIDYLKTKDEEILYNVFDWTQSENSRLAIIAISNTIDFPERLKQKIMSRIGNNRLVFKPYNQEDLETILKQRVESTEVFESNVLYFISKKIAKSSSDIRKCFQILNEAMILHLKQFHDQDLKNSKISTAKVNKAYQLIYSDQFSEAFRCMPKMYKQVLAILAQYFQRDTKILTFQYVEGMAMSKYNIQRKEVKSILQALSDLGLVEIKHMINQSTCFRLLKKWSCKLTIEADRIQYAVLKYDEDLSV